MMFYVYGLLALISIGVILYMASKNYSNIDIYYWSLVICIPIVLLAYTFKAGASGVDDAKLAFCFLYLDSTLLMLLMFLSMLKYLGVEIKIWNKMIAYILCMLHMFTFWACKDTTLYYATFEIEKTPMGTITKMTDGPLKFTHYIYLAVLFIAILSTIIYCILKKKDSSKKALGYYSFFVFAGICGYVIEMVCDFDFSVIPFIIAAGDIVIAIQYEKIHSHDMDCVIVEQKKDFSNRGYVAFDNQKRLLGYNDIATKFVPELVGKRIDDVFSGDEQRLIEVFYTSIDCFTDDEKSYSDFTYEDTIFRCSVSTFCMHKGGNPAGYLVELLDVTAEQGYMNLIREYGASLEKDVADKTEHILYIQERIVLGMATIVENRDMNTGGHVRRTSDIIKILVEEMQRQGVGNIDDRFAKEIIRSAPMHDLGKISIENDILNKPGKLTDDEYKIMKTHSAKSGEIVQAILAGVEEPHFVQTAYRLARFHHERWDGKGYPERLAEIEIPIEARIMAVADVYDALVSKRCYKEPMSFDKAAEIMLDGMGSQFDPMMKPIFEKCRPKLEQYYTEHNEE